MYRYPGVQHTPHHLLLCLPPQLGHALQLVGHQAAAVRELHEVGTEGQQGRPAVRNIYCHYLDKIQLYLPRSYVLPGAHGLLARCDTSQFSSGGSCLLLTQLLRPGSRGRGQPAIGECSGELINAQFIV